MNVTVHTGRTFKTGARERRHIEEDLTHAFEEFADDLASIDAHLSDRSTDRSTGDDIRCLLEAAPVHQEQVTVSHQATTQAEALGGAIRKLGALLSHRAEGNTEKDRDRTSRDS